jgi:hypothetical protein
MLTLEQRIKGAGVNLSNLEVVMGQYWHQMRSAWEKSGAGNEAEISLVAFSGTCHQCGQPGHMAQTFCPQKKDGNNRPKWFKGICYNCGKEGHMSKDCWLKEENKDKRPKG